MALAPLVDPTWLLERLDDPGVVAVDCRWRLGDPGAGRRDYESGHIPGAGFLDVDTDLSGRTGGGRHPLPDPSAFEAAASRAGVDADSTVVAYDEAGEGGAARLWWLLRHFGHSAVAVLDGGLRAWREAGGRLETGAPANPPGRFEARVREDDTISAEELLPRLRDESLALVDARAPERYRGESEPIDPVAGHIPGAGNAPFADLAPAGRYRSPAELRERLEAAGAVRGRELVAYCGSGITACTLILSAELAGFDGARLYPGSWSDWSTRGLPVATGQD